MIINGTPKRISGYYIERWDRKIQRAKNSTFYVTIPRPIMDANGLKKRSNITFYKVFDEQRKCILFVIDFDGG